MYTVKVSEAFTDRSHIFRPVTKYEFETKNFTHGFSCPNQEYRVNDILHKENGPAVIIYDKNGLKYTKFYSNGRLARMLTFESRKLSSGHLQNYIIETLYEDDFKTVRTPTIKIIDKKVGIFIKGIYISVHKNEQKISGKFEPDESAEEAVKKELLYLQKHIASTKAEQSYRDSPTNKNHLSIAEKRYTKLLNWAQKNKIDIINGGFS